MPWLLKIPCPPMVLNVLREWKLVCPSATRAYLGSIVDAGPLPHRLSISRVVVPELTPRGDVKLNSDNRLHATLSPLGFAVDSDRQFWKANADGVREQRPQGKRRRWRTP